MDLVLSRRGALGLATGPKSPAVRAWQGPGVATRPLCTYQPRKGYETPTRQLIAQSTGGGGGGRGSSSNRHDGGGDSGDGASREGASGLGLVGLFATGVALAFGLSLGGHLLGSGLGHGAGQHGSGHSAGLHGAGQDAVSSAAGSSTGADAGSSADGSVLVPIGALTLAAIIWAAVELAKRFRGPGGKE